MAEQQRLTEVFVELADTLVDDFDVVEFLTTLVDRSVELLHASEAGVLVADENQRLRSVASSSDTARLLDLYELQRQEGPCFECYRTGTQFVNQSLKSSDAWPDFGQEAQRLGFNVVHALPMRLRQHVVGAVNIFSVDERYLEESEIAIGQALADVATIGLLQERGIREARLVSEQLQVALQSRIVIEQAKGALAERQRVGMDTAFELIRRYARRSNQKLVDVAAAIVERRLDSRAVADGS